ncbi:MAG: dockerin type I repeat-containing protein [Phycisphaerales bacterium]
MDPRFQYTEGGKRPAPRRAPAYTLVIACALSQPFASTATAQDSTASAQTGSDALSAYDTNTQRARYVVDMSPLSSSWGSAFLIAPVLKTPAELDPLFRTQVAGSTAVSPEHAANVSFAPTAFARWTAPGTGINPIANTAPNPANGITVSGFTRRFAAGLTGVSAGATNVVTATIGQRAQEPTRVYVERVHALASRDAAASADTATLTLGAIDASGTAIVRADDATAKSPISLRRDNLLRVSSPARNPAVVAALSWPVNELPITTDPGAVAYLAYNLSVAVTNPAAIGSPLRALSLDFASRYLVSAVAQPSVLGPGMFGLRGNPSFAPAFATAPAGWPAAAAGYVASFARTGIDAPTNALNVFTVDAQGTPIGSPPASPRAAVVPSPLVGEGGFTINTSGSAQFRQYRNQSLFRGPTGHVGIGFDAPTGTLALAAVLSDPVAPPAQPVEALVVCRMSDTPTWHVVARVGTPVLSGPVGTPVGSIAPNAPVVFSAPAMDRLGNVYFVAAFQPTGGGTVGQALIKAVRSTTAPSGYTLERILHSGQTFTGVNSTRPWTITRLRLADSDSIDSGGFHAAAVLQSPMPGTPTVSASDPRAFGGCVVNAVISYDAAPPSGTTQVYEAMLLVTPGTPPPACPADLNGDGVVNTSDLVTFLGRFGQTVTPGATGDLNGDGQVNTQDLTRFLSGFGCGG